MNSFFVRKRRKFLSFLGLVINSAAEAKRKSARIEIVVDIVGAIAEEVEAIETGFKTPSGPTLSRIIILLQKFFHVSFPFKSKLKW